MAYEQKEGQGSLFKNDNTANQKAPAYKGTITIAGVSYQLSAWLKTSEKGTKWMSLSAQVQTPVPNRPTQSTAPKVDSGSVFDMDEDIPF